MHHPILAMTQSKRERIPKKIRELQGRAWSVWEDIHRLVNECGHDDKIFLQRFGLNGFPIKSPTLEITDNLKSIGDWLIEQRSPEEISSTHKRL